MTLRLLARKEKRKIKNRTANQTRACLRPAPVIMNSGRVIICGAARPDMTPGEKHIVH